MRYCLRIKNAVIGDDVVFLDTDISYNHGVVKKMRSRRAIGETGNVLIETADGSQQWVLGSKIVKSVKDAEKQIAYNLKHRAGE